MQLYSRFVLSDVAILGLLAIPAIRSYVGRRVNSHSSTSRRAARGVGSPHQFMKRVQLSAGTLDPFQRLGDRSDSVDRGIRRPLWPATRPCGFTVSCLFHPVRIPAVGLAYMRSRVLWCCCSEGFVIWEVPGPGEDDAACDFDGVVGEAFVEPA